MDYSGTSDIWPNDVLMEWVKYIRYDIVFRNIF